MSDQDSLSVVGEFMRGCPRHNMTLNSWRQKYRPIFLGIDPGATGAMAFLHPVRKELSVAIDIPTTKVATTKKTRSGKTSYRTQTDLCALWELFESFRPWFWCLQVVIEQQQPMPRDTALTGFSVGKNFGMWPLFLHSHEISQETIRPVVWKKRMGLIRKDKEAARLKAQMLFPKAALSRKKDHNRAEALLIAECVSREYLSESTK